MTLLPRVLIGLKSDSHVGIHYCSCYWYISFNSACKQQQQQQHTVMIIVGLHFTLLIEGINVLCIDM